MSSKESAKCLESESWKNAQVVWSYLEITYNSVHCYSDFNHNLEALTNTTNKHSKLPNFEVMIFWVVCSPLLNLLSIFLWFSYGL